MLLGTSLLYGLVLLAYASVPSLWGDEGFTAVMVDAPLGQILRDLTKIDVNMGAYYVLEHGVVAVLGDGEVQLRLLSIASAAAALPAMWYLVAALWSARAATLSTILLAANPFVIVVALTARPYALLVLMSVLTARAALSASRSGSTRAYIVWSLLCVFMLYVHLLAVPLIAAQGLFIVMRRRRIDRGAVAASVLLGLGCVPTAAFIAPGDTLNWVQPFAVADALYVTATASGGKAFGAISLLLALAGVLSLVVGFARRERPTPDRWLLAFWGAAPLLLMLVLIPIQSLFVTYYFAPVLVPLAVFGGVALSNLTPKAAIALVVLLLLASTASVVSKAHSRSLVSKQDWRAASALLGREATSSEAVAYPNSFYRIVAEYYAAGRAHTWERAHPILPSAPWGSLRPWQLDSLKRTGALSGTVTITTAASTASSIWLVGPPDTQFVRDQATLAAAGFSVTAVRQVPGIQLVHMTPAQ